MCSNLCYLITFRCKVCPGVWLQMLSFFCWYCSIFVLFQNFIQCIFITTPSPQLSLTLSDHTALPWNLVHPPSLPPSFSPSLPPYFPLSLPHSPVVISLSPIFTLSGCDVIHWSVVDLPWATPLMKTDSSWEVISYPNYPYARILNDLIFYRTCTGSQGFQELMTSWSCHIKKMLFPCSPVWYLALIIFLPYCL